MRISIALCTYNGAKYLGEQLDSLFNQTLKPYEIVVSDDLSTDETMAILKEYQNVESSIEFRIIQNSEKLGVFKNFPLAISHCTGDIVFTCDQDDYWLPNKLQKHMEVHTSNPNIDLVFSNADVVLNDLVHYLYPLWEIKQILNEQEGQASFKSLVIKGRSIAGCCMSFKRAFLEKIVPFPDDIYHDDWIATCACLFGQIKGISDSLIKYRQHGNNAVGIVRGNKLSFYKSLYTNVPFYVKSDIYIYRRHLKIYRALSDLKLPLLSDEQFNPNSNLEFYRSRSNYSNEGFFKVLNELTMNFINHRYKYHNGIFTYLKDIYNLMYIKILKVDLDS